MFPAPSDSQNEIGQNSLNGAKYNPRQTNVIKSHIPRYAFGSIKKTNHSKQKPPAEGNPFLNSFHKGNPVVKENDTKRNLFNGNQP